jgi:nucleoside-diphosphate-sugar epimerase
MKVFVIGATGFVGGAVARHLLAQGHYVSGLARSTAAADRLTEQGIQPIEGDLDTGLASSIATALEHDAVVFAAQLPPCIELPTVDAFLEAIEGTGKTFLFTSGSGVLLQRTGGAWSPDVFTEDGEFTVEPLALERKTVEDHVRDSPDRGVRGIVIRAGMIWGPGDQSHVAMAYQSVAALGAAAYVGTGLNVYSHLHIDDAVRLFELALLNGAAGALYHAVAGETPTRWIAEAVARDLGVETRSLDMDEAASVWGEFGALIAAASSRIRAPRSTSELGWRPTRLDMLDEVGNSDLRKLAGGT